VGCVPGLAARVLSPCTLLRHEFMTSPMRALSLFSLATAALFLWACFFFSDGDWSWVFFCFLGGWQRHGAMFDLQFTTHDGRDGLILGSKKA